MHDPMVVAFEIRRPWPRRDSFYDGKPGKPRWAISLPFITLAGRGFRFPCLITVWHAEPGGKDAGEVCKHYVKYPDRRAKVLNGWRWHVWHWRIQVVPLQALRRRLLTRCAWCGGKSRKGDAVNISHQWDAPKSRWWKGEPGLFHRDCSSIEHAHKLCMCEISLPRADCSHQCALCDKHILFDRRPDEAHRALAALPAGSRMPKDVKEFVEAIWSEKRQETQP